MKTVLLPISIASAVVMFLISGCATVEVNTDYNPQADFSKLKTYSWKSPVQPATGDVRVDNSLVDARVRTAVDKHLVANGYVPDTAGQPDFTIGYVAAVNDKIEVTYVNDAYGYGPGWSGGHTDSSSYDEGALILDISDPKSHELLWRGTATATIDPEATPKEREQKIDQAVAKMLKEFPPEKQ